MIMRAQTGRAFIGSAIRKRRGVEGVDRRT
jgi:hypothetical protein